MPKRGGAKISGRSRRARPRKSTNAPSSSSSVDRTTSNAKHAEKPKKSSAVSADAALNVVALRAQLARALGWHDAHVDLDRAVAGLAPELRGRRPPGLAHSAWEIVEHIRIAQHDIFDFCVNASYAEMKWPDEYWPPTPAPPSPSAWDASLAAYRRDLQAMQDLASRADLDLFAKIPHGSGQTYLREIVLVIDHNAYHVGELVTLRRLLGAWDAQS